MNERIEPIAVSIDAACKAAGVGRTLLYSELQRGNIEAVKCGSKTLVVVASLRAFIARLPAANLSKSRCNTPRGTLGSATKHNPPIVTGNVYRFTADFTLNYAASVHDFTAYNVYVLDAAGKAALIAAGAPMVAV